MLNTKNLVIFGTGVLAGYLLTQYLSGKIAKGDGTPMTPPIDGGVVSPNTIDKQAICEQKLMEATSVMKFSSETGMEDFKAQFMSDCLATI
jgi:hypothetical protein